MPVIPDFELLRCIGRGGFGEVWLARDIAGDYRAVKILRLDSAKETATSKKDFEGLCNYKEVSLTHSGLAKILHVGRGNGFFYYVMELADDRVPQSPFDPATYSPHTLETVDIEDGRPRQPERLPVEFCLRIGLALAAAVEHLHSRGLLHRDIKPSNVLFVGGLPQLADPSLVTPAAQAATNAGTVGYVPPQGPNSYSADLFALGRVLYEIGTGLDRLQSPELPTELERLPDWHRIRRFWEVAVRACDFDPERRFASATELREALERLQWEPPPPKPRVLFLWLLAVLIAMVTGGVVIWRHFRSSTRALPSERILDLVTNKKPPNLPPRQRMVLEFKIIAERGFVSDLQDGEALTNQATYAVLARPQTPGHFYVVQIDSAQRHETLFPHMETHRDSSGTNPVLAGKNLRMPPDDNEWFPLDSVEGRELFVAILSAVPWPELEAELAEPRPSQRQIEQRRVSSSEDTPEQFRGKDPTVRRGQRAPHLTTYTNENGLVVIERVIRHVSPQTQPQRYSEPHVNR